MKKRLQIFILTIVFGFVCFFSVACNSKKDVSYIVSFDTCNGDEFIEEVQVKEGDYLQEKITPKRAGYKFLGWYTDENYTHKFYYNMKISGNITLYAKWKELVYYNVTFNAGEGVSVPGQSVESGEVPEIPECKRVGYRLDGWFLDKEYKKEFTFGNDAHIESDTILYAKWTKVYKVTYVVSNSEELQDEVVAGERAENKSVTKYGYSFVGWYKDLGYNYEFNYNEPIDADLTLYAKWIEVCSVNYVTNCSESIPTTIISKGSTVQAPKVLKRDGYRFLGWYLANEQEFDFNKPVNDDVTIYAKWEQVFMVNFVTNYSISVPDAQIDNGGVITQPMLYRDGYELLGWYTDDKFVNEFNFSTKIYEDTTLYAKWARNIADLCEFTSYDDESLNLAKYNEPENELFDLVVLPQTYQGKSVVRIGTGAFKNAMKIESIIIPDGYQIIAGSAFEDCSIKSVQISDSVSVIGEQAFKGARCLSSINLPNHLKRIEKSTFSSCSELASINIPEGVTYIGSDAFYGCDTLTCINIPATVQIIDGNVFSMCSGLESISVAMNNSRYTSIYYADDFVINGVVDWETHTLIIGCKNTRIPDNGPVIIIGKRAFAGALVERITIPECITKIDEKAFDACTSLTSITIKDAEVIGNYAFQGCTSLSTVELYEGVKTISDYAFASCTKLDKIYIPYSVDYLGSCVFGGCGEINVSVYPYKTDKWDENWDGLCVVHVTYMDEK